MAALTSVQKAVYQKFWTSSRNLETFKMHLIRYLSIREGVLNRVYKDSKGIPTVGIGHKVLMGDNLALGQTISDEKVMQLFYSDYSRLRIDSFINVSWWSVPQKIAVASFIWTHGFGQFAGGATEKMMQNKDTTPQQLQAWVAKNWDLTSPVNVVRNRADLSLWGATSDREAGNYYHSSSPSGDYYFHPVLKDSFFQRSDMVSAVGVKKGSLPGLPPERSQGDIKFPLMGVALAAAAAIYFLKG
jgi:GH24 family phage-related lysozyme (muramidase)